MRIGAQSAMKRLSQEHVNRIASRARALGEPTRVRILDVLARGEQSVGHIAAAIDSQQSTVSKHLQVLYHAGLVERRRSASEVIYSITSSEIFDWIQYLSTRSLA
jgi:DNA-binding transcriptional ArsR family regulator